MTENEDYTIEIGVLSGVDESLARDIATGIEAALSGREAPALRAEAIPLVGHVMTAIRAAEGTR